MAKLSWDDLQYFLAVAQTGQLSRAAHALQSSHVTVSRHIQRLEETMQVALFVRGPKGYDLTAAGAQLRDFAERIERDASRLPAVLSGAASEIGGNIRLNMPEAICNFFCSEMLSEFRHSFPALSLELVAIQQHSSFTPNANDLSILLEAPKNALFHAEKLADYTLQVYGARSYLEARPPITSRSDLQHHDFIGYIESMIFMPSLDYLAEVAPKLRVTLQFSSIFSQLLAVRQGLGLAVLPCFLAAKHPELRPIMGDEIVLHRSYWMVCRNDLRFAPRESALIEALQRSFRAQADLLSPSAHARRGRISPEPR